MGLKWNKEKIYVDFSMGDYVRHALHKFDHNPPNKPQHTPNR